LTNIIGFVIMQSDPEVEVSNFTETLGFFYGKNF